MNESAGGDYVRKLQKLADEHAEEYQRNTPFPHIYFDNFLPPGTAEAALRDFPDAQESRWYEFDDPNQKKLYDNVVERLPPGGRDALYFLNSPLMLKFLETLTGIQNLIPDPYYSGAGLHQIRPGGFLRVHADFNWHPKLLLDRRLNLLVYLNKDWKEEYGGHLELWDKDMSAAIKKILPVFNRCAIFSTTDFSYHGHPTPLSCPLDRTRKSLATYYYSNGRPEEEKSDAHSTLWPRSRSTRQ